MGFVLCMAYISSCHSRYGPCKWKMQLQCNAISHWLNSYPEWSLHFHLKVQLELCCVWGFAKIYHPMHRADIWWFGKCSDNGNHGLHYLIHEEPCQSWILVKACLSVYCCPKYNKWWMWYADTWYDSNLLNFTVSFGVIICELFYYHRAPFY